jgi:hypothetical protein
MTWAPTPSITWAPTPSPTPSMTWAPTPSPTPFMTPTDSVARTLAPTYYIYEETKSFKISVNIIVDQGIFQLDTNVFLDSLEKYTNSSFYDFSVESLKRLNLRQGVENWETCNLNAVLSVSSTTLPSLNNIKNVFEEKSFQEDVRTKICEIRSIDVYYSEECKTVDQLCETNMDCCNEATCQDGICSIRADAMEKINCNDDFEFQGKEWWGYLSTDDCEQDLSIEAINHYIFIYDRPSKLMEMEFENLNIMLQPFRIYYIQILKKEMTCDDSVVIKCFH